VFRQNFAVEFSTVEPTSGEAKFFLEKTTRIVAGFCRGLKIFVAGEKVEKHVHGFVFVTKFSR
jgi:hypothetical protein